MDPYYWHNRRNYWIHIAIMVGTEMGQIDCMAPDKRIALNERRQRLGALGNKLSAHIGHLNQVREDRCKRLYK
jgi:hypothetical protein